MVPRFSAFSTWLIIAVLMSASAVASAQQESNARAVSLLEHSMSRTLTVNVVAIISQRDPSGPGFQRIKIERDKTGRVRKSVLSPLRMQGVESIDDGERSITTLPDERLIIDQESPLKNACDTDFRINLVKRNYIVRVVNSVKVAGRSALCVSAQPRARGMDTRRFYIDRSTYFPLKLETVDSEGRTSVQYDTHTIDYPDQLPADVFTLGSTTGMNYLRYDRPKSYSTASIVKASLGFVPILPKDLPMGFEVQEIQLNQTPEWRSLAIRLTDGLARATVYEYRMTADEGKVKAMDSRTTRTINGVRLLLVSDLDSELRQRILATFSVPASESSQDSPTRENSPGKQMVPVDQGNGELTWMWQTLCMTDQWLSFTMSPWPIL